MSGRLRFSSPLPPSASPSAPQTSAAPPPPLNSRLARSTGRCSRKKTHTPSNTSPSQNGLLTQRARHSFPRILFRLLLFLRLRILLPLPRLARAPGPLLLRLPLIFPLLHIPILFPPISRRKTPRLGEMGTLPNSRPSNPSSALPVSPSSIPSLPVSPSMLKMMKMRKTSPYLKRLHRYSPSILFPPCTRGRRCPRILFAPVEKMAAAGRMPPRGPSGLFTRRASAAHKELQARQAIADAQHSTLLPRKSDGMEVDGEDDDDGSSTAVGECPSPPVSASALVKGGNAKPKEKAMSDFGGKYAKSTSRTVSVNDKDGDAMQHEGRPVRARRGTEKIKAQEEEHASASPAVGGGAEVGMRRRSSRTVPAPVPLRAESPQEQQLKRGVGRPSKPKVQPALESKQEESTPAPRRLSLRVKPPTRPPLKEEGGGECGE
ncbi:hypothetical protein C8F04DRAFT_653516 [Mycena alexandri]|uniref:Uncharacterized protein n=1 Tax=Mycena alexandri TaxID=1745969 RepID=A0AAD6X0X0_9AGAR|nr:hypothetical protein C8F04DRAFT_653516 [Mycena alexandri]